MTVEPGRPPAAELPRPFAVDELGFEPVTVTVDASPTERTALAARFDLVALHRLTARLRLRWRQRNRHLEISGDLEADLTQTCVVTLEPVEARLAESFHAEFLRGLTTTAEVDLLLDPGDDDPPEPLDGPLIDLGELVAQHLSLAIDPYPRAPGVSFDEVRASLKPVPEDDDLADNPFGKLAALQEKQR